jgi:hypothetical protein
MTKEEALAELARRFFQSHGPATVQDFARWASFTLVEAKNGLAAVSAQLHSAEGEGGIYWFAPPQTTGEIPQPFVHLLPIYDEYVNGYKALGAIVDAGNAAQLQAMGNNLTAVIVLDGRIIGTWKRKLDQRLVTITPQLFAPPSAVESEAIAAAIQRYGVFLAVPARSA